jgi:hypothetical protein
MTLVGPLQLCCYEIFANASNFCAARYRTPSCFCLDWAGRSNVRAAQNRSAHTAVPPMILFLPMEASFQPGTPVRSRDPVSD